jgi:hypothetical protein
MPQLEEVDKILNKEWKSYLKKRDTLTVESLSFLMVSRGILKEIHQGLANLEPSHIPGKSSADRAVLEDLSLLIRVLEQQSGRLLRSLTPEQSLESRHIYNKLSSTFSFFKLEGTQGY